jgi:GAF domain-containing protein
MFAALSATNEAIMRAKSRAQLFELVCVAAANGGKFTSTTIGLVNPNSDFLDIVAVAGPTAETTKNVKLSINDAHPEGRGLSGTAFRSRQACISNDYLADQRGSAFHATIRSDGAKSGAAFPLLIRGQAVGIMLFISAEEDTFIPEFAELLQRLADNVSFALENFERADEKAKADARIEYLASHDSLTSLPAIFCWWKSATGCAKTSVQATSWRGWAATNSSSFLRKPRKEMTSKTSHAICCLSSAHPCN